MGNSDDRPDLPVLHVVASRLLVWDRRTGLAAIPREVVGRNGGPALLGRMLRPGRREAGSRGSSPPHGRVADRPPCFFPSRRILAIPPWLEIGGKAPAKLGQDTDKTSLIQAESLFRLFSIFVYFRQAIALGGLVPAFLFPA